MDNFENEEQIQYTLDELMKQKKPRKSRAKPRMKTIVEEPEYDTEVQHLNEPVIFETEPEANDKFVVSENDFLSELHNNNEEVYYPAPLPYDPIPPPQPAPKRKSRAKPKMEILYRELVIEQEDLFSSEPTPILGRDRLVVLQKIKQYRVLFPTELKGFKVGINSYLETLENSLLEIETLIELGNADSFIADSIIECVKLVKGTTANLKNYNITGLSALLKSNNQFHSLLKQLYLKYNTFSQIPPETQLIMIVATSALICTQKNKNKEKIEAFLNEPIQVN